MNNGLNFILPFNSAEGPRALENYTAACRRHNADTTSKARVEMIWRDKVSHDDILTLADSMAMRHLWVPFAQSSSHHVFMMNESRGKLPCQTLALAYIGAFSSPFVSIICPPGLSKAYRLVNELFVEGKAAPPPIYESFSSFLDTLRVAA